MHMLTGNGMHLVSQAAWMIYVMSHCARRDWFESSPRIMPEADDEVDKEGSGCEADEEADDQESTQCQ